MRWWHGEKRGGIRGDREEGEKKENTVQFITPICIMGLIGPQCTFSGVGEQEWEGGSWQGEYRSRKSGTSARMHLLDWLVMGAAGSPPPGCFDNMASGAGGRGNRPPPLAPSIL